MRQVEISQVSNERAFAALIGEARTQQLQEDAQATAAALQGARVINCNATATGGGVAEMLQVLLATVNALGVETHWYVLDGEPDFFAITKRIHNVLHGDPGDGGPLGDAERAVFERVLASNLKDIASELREGDVFLAHDPQTAGLIPGLKDLGVKVIWRSHIGKDDDDEQTAKGWAFLEPYITQADAAIFTRSSYVPPFELDMPIHIIAPSIDPFAPKNVALDDDAVHAGVVRAGIIAGDQDAATATFTRRNGTESSVRAHTGLVLDDEPIPADAQLVLQVSRWDALKDMPGVMEGFLRVLDQLPDTAHLALVGPAVEGVSDDPEGQQILADCRAMRAGLPEEQRRRVHLVALPMDDIDENAHMVNCIQRFATVVVQKSLVEGFGLTVTEAMWKNRPLIASAVGGIQDQISHQVDGLLLKDPRDLDTYGRYLVEMMSNPELAKELGDNAHDKAFHEFVGDRHLHQYGILLGQLHSM